MIFGVSIVVIYGVFSLLVGTGFMVHAYLESKRVNAHPVKMYGGAILGSLWFFAGLFLIGGRV